ncbi:hypothetical protein TMatcc_003135 [Talaromyces marneffei ATCC 18224]
MASVSSASVFCFLWGDAGNEASSNSGLATRSRFGALLLLSIFKVKWKRTNLPISQVPHITQSFLKAGAEPPSVWVWSVKAQTAIISLS